MAMISLPADITTNLVDQAITKPFIKNSPEEIFGFSRVLTQLEENDKALAIINKAIKADKNDDFVYWRARLFLLLEQEAKAEKDYLWLLKKDPGNTVYISQYATLLNYLKRNQEALDMLKEHEQHDELLFKQIVLLLQQNDIDAAELKFAKLKNQLMIDSLDEQQKLEIGELAYWLKDYDLSLELLQNVKSGNQVNEAKLLMANVLVEQEDYERAAVLYHQVQNGPEDHAIPAYLFELNLFQQQEDYNKALEVANTGLQMFKGNSDLLYSRAMLAGQMDDIAALERDLTTIINDDPNNAAALNALGYTWADKDMNLDQAYDYIMQAHTLDPEDKAILDSVGWVYYKKGDFEQAEKYLRRAVDGNQRDSESYQHLIVVLQETGQMTAADEIKELAQKLFPDESF